MSNGGRRVDPVLSLTLSYSKSQLRFDLRPASQWDRVTGSRGFIRQPSIEREESSFVCYTPIVVNK